MARLCSLTLHAIISDLCGRGALAPVSLRGSKGALEDEGRSSKCRLRGRPWRCNYIDLIVLCLRQSTHKEAEGTRSVTFVRQSGADGRMTVWRTRQWRVMSRGVSADKLIRIARCAEAHANRRGVESMSPGDTRRSSIRPRHVLQQRLLYARCEETRRTCQALLNNTRIYNSSHEELRPRNESSASPRWDNNKC